MELVLPKRKEINVDAPNMCVLSRPGLDDVKVDVIGAKNSFNLDISQWPSVKNTAALSAKMKLRVFLCEKDIGTCTVMTKTFAVHLKNDESLESKIKIELNSMDL